MSITKREELVKKDDKDGKISERCVLEDRSMKKKKGKNEGEAG